jgi:hypothetical protein
VIPAACFGASFGAVVDDVAEFAGDEDLVLGAEVGVDIAGEAIGEAAAGSDVDAFAMVGDCRESRAPTTLARPARIKTTPCTCFALGVRHPT